jgi:dihydroorotate dehydrogenase
MRKFIVSIFLIAAVSTGASAQNEQGGNRPPRMDRTVWAKRRTEMMVQKYGLNEEQAKALQELNEKQMPRGNGQRPPRPDSTQAERPKGPRGPRPGGNWQEMQKEYNEQLQKIMTADQFKAYMEDMEKRRQERGNRPGRP